MDVYQQVTDTIIRAIESDPANVKLPWHRFGSQIPENPSTGNSYNGVNIISLWCEAQLRGFNSAHWATYKQWTELGGQVRKGEKSSLVIFYKAYTVEQGEEEETRRVIKWSYAFNSEQVEGWTPPQMTDLPPVERIERVEQVIKATRAVIKEGGGRAFYSSALDEIHMPDSRLFFTEDRQEAWYSVLLHELTHWSGHETRLNRQLTNRFGDEAYAAEELIAELGAAFACAKLGITSEVRPDHAQYINSWLQALKRDKKYIFTSAARAEDAIQYLIPAT